MTNEEVFNHHLTAFGDHNMEALISDYTEESIVVTPQADYKGTAEIESFFAELFPLFPAEGTEVEIDKLFTENDILYITWHGSTPSLDIPFATDTFVIQDGKIKVQTFGAVMNPVE